MAANGFFWCSYSLTPLSGASDLTSLATNTINIVPKPNAQRRNRFFSKVESQQGYLLRFAMALKRDAAQAEEVVQETLLTALAGIDRFYGKSDFLRRLAFRYAEGARVESAGCNTAKNVTR